MTLNKLLKSELSSFKKRLKLHQAKYEYAVQKVKEYKEIGDAENVELWERLVRQQSKITRELTDIIVLINKGL